MELLHQSDREIRGDWLKPNRFERWQTSDNVREPAVWFQVTKGSYPCCKSFGPLSYPPEGLHDRHLFHSGLSGEIHIYYTNIIKTGQHSFHNFAVAPAEKMTKVPRGWEGFYGDEEFFADRDGKDTVVEAKYDHQIFRMLRKTKFNTKFSICGRSKESIFNQKRIQNFKFVV